MAGPFMQKIFIVVAINAWAPDLSCVCPRLPINKSSFFDGLLNYQALFGENATKKGILVKLSQLLVKKYRRKVIPENLIQPKV